MKINTIVNRWDTREQREGKAQRGVVTVERLAGVPKGGEGGSEQAASQSQEVHSQYSQLPDISKAKRNIFIRNHLLK